MLINLTFLSACTMYFPNLKVHLSIRTCLNVHPGLQHNAEATGEWFQSRSYFQQFFHQLPYVMHQLFMSNLSCFFLFLLMNSTYTKSIITL